MNSPAAAAATGRIAVLGALVIDQIAAGEVVERPASVVKELVDNSLDAGATRVDVELEDGGLARISVRDNGRGIHPDDLLLAVTRHATSKLRHATDIADIATLGFRGEALASVAAVARVDLRSRQPGAAVGMHLHNIPGEVPTLTPAGMPVGTQIEVHALFANVPARRKFMRAEATEVGHCSDTLLRLAIVHPGVHFTLRHGKRELLNLPRATREGRVAQVLERRVAGPFFAFQGEDDGVRVEVFLPHPNAAGRGRGSPYLITRQRVVRERSLGQILAQAYGLGGEAPSACLFVEPPPGAVDVNVHPQKVEVRFSEPQQVYAAVRRVLAAAVAAAPWADELAAACASGHAPKGMSGSSRSGERDQPDAKAAEAGLSSGTDEAGARVAIPPGRAGAIPIGFAPARTSPLDPPRGASWDDDAPPRRARGVREADDAPPRRGLGDVDETDDDALANDDDGRLPARRRSAEHDDEDDAGDGRLPARRRGAEHDDAGDGRLPARGRGAEHDDGLEGPAPRGDESRARPGDALRRLEHAAAVAAAGRRAEAEAWLARAEASVDAVRRPLTELERADAPQVGQPSQPRPDDARPTAPARDRDDVSGWDLDLADAPSGLADMSSKTSARDARSAPTGASDVSGDMSSAPDSARSDLSPETSHAADSRPTAPPDLSPETSEIRPPAQPPGASAAWLERAGADAELADPARERAAAWLERADAEPPPDLHASDDPLLRWSELQPEQPRPPAFAPAPEDRRPGAYRLSTRALEHGYDRHKRAVMEAAAALRPDAGPARPGPAEPDEAPALLPTLGTPGPRDMRETTGPTGQPAAAPRPDVPALLACLPGPVALFADRDAILAVDLRRVRSHLVYLRLQRDLVGRRAVAVQGLLSPAVVQRPAADVALIQAARAELLGLGVDLDVFGDDAVVVRGVPAHLRHCVDDADAADLVARIVPWLRIRSEDGDRAARERGLLDAIAATRGGDPAPRLARRWLAELIDAGAALESVPGIRRWTADALLGSA